LSGGLGGGPSGGTAGASPALTASAAVIPGRGTIAVAPEHKHIWLHDFDAAIPLHVTDAARQGEE